MVVVWVVVQAAFAWCADLGCGRFARDEFTGVVEPLEGTSFHGPVDLLRSRLLAGVQRSIASVPHAGLFDHGIESLLSGSPCLLSGHCIQ